MGGRLPSLRTSSFARQRSTRYGEQTLQPLSAPEHSGRPLTPLPRISTACDFWTGSGDFGIEFKVSLSGLTIIPWGPVCPFCADPANAESGCRYGAYYEKRTATFTSPASGSGSLVISVRQAAGLNAVQVPALFDQIFVNPLGDTSSNNPAQIPF